jgi:hypothetical protein
VKKELKKRSPCGHTLTTLQKPSVFLPRPVGLGHITDAYLATVLRTAAQMLGFTSHKDIINISPERAYENAEIEAVSDKVEFRTDLGFTFT